MANRLSHLFVHVLDLQEYVRFWTEVVGLELLVEEVGYARVGGNGGFSMGLEQRPSGSVGAVGIQIAIQVDDVHTTYAVMQAAGVHFSEPPRLQPWGAVHAWFLDLDGYACSIYSS